MTMLYINKGCTSKIKDTRIQCLYNTLCYYGIDIDPYILFILGKGIGFTLKILHYKSDSNIKLWLVSGSNSCLEQNLLSNLQIHKRHIFQDNSYDGALIKKAIANNKPILARVDTKKMDIGRFRTFSSYATVPVIGYDNQKVMIDTMNGNVDILSDADFKLSIDTNDYDSFKESCYTLEIQDEKHIYSEDSIKQMVFTSLLEMCNHMLEDKSSGNTYFGIYGIKVLLERLKEFKECIQYMDTDKMVLEKLYKIRIKTIWKGLITESDTFYREELGLALQKVGQVFGIPQLYEIGSSFLTVAKLWKELIWLTIVAEQRVSLSNQHKQKSLDSMINCIHKILHQEEILFNDLCYKMLKDLALNI